VSELQDGIQRLRQQVTSLQQENARIRTVSITGPNEFPVYAQGQLDTDGHRARNGVWHVNLTSKQACTSEDQLAALEVRIGSTGKPLIDDRGLLYCAQNGYDPLTRQGGVIFYEEYRIWSYVARSIRKAGG